MKPFRHDGGARTVNVPPQLVAPVIDHLDRPQHPSNRDSFDPGSSGTPAAGQGGGRRSGGAYPKGRGR
jgi:hypothetical protein